MDKEALWSKFEMSGKIEDYLNYVNVDKEVINEADQGEGSSNKGSSI